MEQITNEKLGYLITSFEEEETTQNDEFAAGIQSALYELAEYRKAKAEGRLVELPKTGIGYMSDGYHTFNELYHHRAVLFSVVVNSCPEKCWKSKKHDDGTMFDGMFVVGAETPTGNATYHYDIEPYWNMFHCKEIDNAPAWDGHTPDDAIRRIASLTHEVALEAQEGNR